MNTIELVIDVQKNTLIVGENGGHICSYPGDTLRWVSGTNQPFTLEFFRYAFEKADVADWTSCTDAQQRIDVGGLDHWPFADPAKPPPGGVTAPDTRFEGRLKTEVGMAFKYYVAMGNLKLDPIIIVVRR